MNTPHQFSKEINYYRRKMIRMHAQNDLKQFNFVKNTTIIYSRIDENYKLDFELQLKLIYF